MVRLIGFFLFTRYVVMGIRFIVPWIVRVILFTLRLAATSVISLWVGVPTAVSRIANQWQTRAIIAGFPTEYDTYLYYTLSAVAFLTIVAGWVLFAYLTVWMLGMIF